MVLLWLKDLSFLQACFLFYIGRQLTTDFLLKDFLVFDKSSILFRQKAVPRYDRPDLSVLKSRFVSGNTNLDCIPSKRKRVTYLLPIS